MAPIHTTSGDEIVATYRSTGSIRETARKHDISTQTVRRILITNGIPLGEGTLATRIIAMLETMPPEEVAAKLGCAVKTIKAYTPYSRGSYAVGEKSINAERIAKSRQRKKEDTP